MRALQCSGGPSPGTEPRPPDQMGALIYIVVLCGKRAGERRLTLLMLARTSSNGTEIESKVGLLIAIQLERKYLRD